MATFWRSNCQSEQFFALRGVENTTLYHLVNIYIDIENDPFVDPFKKNSDFLISSNIHVCLYQKALVFLPLQPSSPRLFVAVFPLLQRLALLPTATACLGVVGSVPT